MNNTITNIKANSAIGLQVTTIKEGKNIYKVKDVVYDGKLNKVTALVVDEKGWFNNAKIIQIQDITSIGHDAVLIEDETKVINANDSHKGDTSAIANDDNFLTKNEVLTEGGTNLGRVTDIYFDFPSGSVDAIEVSQGIIKNILSGTKKVNITDIITVGDSNLIVKDFTEDKFDHQGEEQGLTKVFSDTKSVVSDAATTVSNKTSETAQNLKQSANDWNQDTDSHGKTKMDQFKENVSQKFDQAKTSISQTVSETKDAAGDKTNQVKEDLESKRIEGAVGKILVNTAILDKQDQTIAAPGDIITHKIVDLAKANGVLYKLLDNVADNSTQTNI